MKERVLEIVDNYIKNEEQKRTLLDGINELLVIFNENMLEVLNDKNRNLLENIFNKLIPDFSNNQSYINSREIYKSYQQFGDIEINHSYLIEVNKLLLYLRNVLLVEKNKIIINDNCDFKELYKQIKNEDEDIRYDLVDELLKKSNLSKEEYEVIYGYLNDKQNSFNKRVLLSQTLNNDQLNDNSTLILDIARQIFISEIDKISNFDDKLKKLDELILNNIYGNNTNKTNSIEIFKVIIKEEILEEQQLMSELDEKERRELVNNIDELFKLMEYLNKKEKEFEDDEEVKNTYFDYENHVNTIIYVSNSILKDIETIDDPKTLQSIYNLLIGIKENNIPIKSHMQKDIMPSRKIKKVRPNSSNSQARIFCELLGNNIYGVILINAKKDTVTSKSTVTSVAERLKLYNPDNILDNINYEQNKAYDKDVYDLIVGKLNKKIAK